MFFYENCEIFKNIYFEEHLSRRLLFASPQIIIKNSSGKYGQGETTGECKVSIYFKGNIFIQLYSAISLKYKLKMLLLHSINILTTYLTLRDLEIFYFSLRMLGWYDVAQKSSDVERKFRLV